MLRFLTSGESHGPALSVVVDGLPAGLPVDRATIDADLRRRQGGYGRGQRQQIEQDTVEILGGIRHGRTLGSPVTLLVRNRDHQNWREVMSPDPVPGGPDPDRALSSPRPGHGDLAGALKYLTGDLRNVLERASARETTARVAAGGLARCLLSACGIEARSHVIGIGEGRLDRDVSWDHLASVDDNPVRCADSAAATVMMAAIDRARQAGDTVGGVFEVVVRGVPPGLGSYAQWDRRLDGRLAQALMAIPAVKAVAVGDGFLAGTTLGSRFHDQIRYRPERGFERPTNHAGGIEAGISNGEELRCQAVVKPIPTLLSPLPSVDLRSKQPSKASVERSDVCVVPAAAVVGEAVVCLVLADALLEKAGGDSLQEVIDHIEVTRQRLRDFVVQPPERS